MLFDVQAALTEILNDAPEAAIPAISPVPPHRLAGKAGIAVVPEKLPAPADVLPFPPQPSASVFARHEPCDVPHGHCRAPSRSDRPMTFRSGLEAINALMPGQQHAFSNLSEAGML